MTFTEAINLVRAKENQGKLLMRWKSYSIGHAWGFENGRWSDFSYLDGYYQPDKKPYWKIEKAILCDFWIDAEYDVITREEMVKELVPFNPQGSETTKNK